MDKYTKEALELIDSGIKLSEDQLQELLDYEIEFERKYGDSGRWSRFVHSILAIGGRYFELHWGQGLTEYQENLFDEQPIEVKPVERTKTVTYTEYVYVKGE